MEQRRFLLAMILSALVIFGWQAFFAPDPDQMADQQEGDAAVEEQVDAEAGADEADSGDADPAEQAADEDEQLAAPADETGQPGDADGPDESEEAAGAEAPEQRAEVGDRAADIDERQDIIETNNMRVRLTNRGAAVANVTITAPEQYTRGSGGDLMRDFKEDAPEWPYELVIDGENISLEGDEMYEVVEDRSRRVGNREDADGSYKKIVYRYTDPNGRFVVDKTFSIDEDAPEDEQFTLDMDVEVRSTLQDGVLAGTPYLDVIAHPDPDKDDHFLNFRPNLLEAVCHNSDDTVRTAFEDLEGYEEYTQHAVDWAGTDTRYFIMALVPLDGAAGCSFDRVEDEYLETRIHHDDMTVGPGDSWESSYQIYMGPKHFDFLSRAGHQLNESVDYGLFSFLARPLRWALARLEGFVGNWGLAIILLTLIIKLLTWPITGKAYTSAQRMKQIQPQIKEIREKYEDDQQRMTEETMKLFKENDVSPLGCLPLLLQMPILYGLFRMIYNSVELYHAEFLWYADLSAPDPWYMLPILMGAVMFFQQKITMSASATGKPQMKVVMKIMPVAFTAFMLFLPAGLVLYYLLNLLVGLFQQFLIKRRFREAEEAGEEV